MWLLFEGDCYSRRGFNLYLSGVFLVHYSGVIHHIIFCASTFLPLLDSPPPSIMAVNANEGGGISLLDDVPDMSQMDYDLEYSVRMGKTE